MIKSYLKIAWRNLKTNRLFSLINIIGLSLGLTITIVLFLFISNELSFNTMYPKKERIYRVLTEINSQFNNETWVTSPPIMASALMDEITNVESAARVYKHNFGNTAAIRANDQNYTADMFFWVDKELLTIFDIPLVKGKAADVLSRPNTVILSESAAQKYFNGVDPIGKTLLVDNRQQLEVTGIYRDFPKNSTLDAHVMASSNGSWFYDRKSWGNLSFETYCLLQENATMEATIAQMDKMLDAKVSKEDQWYSLSLQPFERVHLYSASYQNSYASKIGDITEVQNLGFLAVLVLLIACINYMNLTTARSQKRSKEVGISKTLGALSQSLALRFYVETALITAIAIVLGIVLAILLLPAFNTLTNQQLTIHLLANRTFLWVVLGIWFATTLISGLYPSLYLSKFLPREILSPSSKQDQGNVMFRKGLVVLQFAASTALIVGVLVIYQQTKYIQNKKLGFSPENIMAISTRGLRGDENKDALIQEFIKNADVNAVAFAQGYPGMDVSGYVLQKNVSDGERGLGIQTNTTDANIINVLKLKLLAGKTLPQQKSPNDTIVNVILNETAIAYLGYSPEEAIGKQVSIFNSTTSRIAGVVKDFNFASLHQPIGAYAFHNHTNEAKSYLLVRFNSGNLTNTLTQLKTSFLKIAPNLDFNYSFLDQNLERLYEREKRIARVSVMFSLLAIIVACLGLFGLTAFIAEQRKKEIGVRKVLGASVMNITQMLSKDFLMLVVLALVIAFPIAFWIMSNWLNGFAYRIDIGWVVFVLAGATALLIALLTVSFQAVSAAIANPVKSLRTD
ncbi:MAG: ABC transporter permease [Bacteroidota bacterium]